MHPGEHLLYFSALTLYWVVPVHPYVFVLTSLIVGLSPAITHAGFEQLVLRKEKRIYLGDWFHQLHHQYFDLVISDCKKAQMNLSTIRNY